MVLVNVTLLNYSGKYPFFRAPSFSILQNLLQPSIPQEVPYVLLEITYRHLLCVNNVFQIYCWAFFCFFVCLFVFLSRVICIYLFYNVNCSHLSNQVNCDWFKSTEKVLCLLKETNCSSDFSMVPVYSEKLSAVSFV